MRLQKKECQSSSLATSILISFISAQCKGSNESLQQYRIRILVSPLTQCVDVQVLNSALVSHAENGKYLYFSSGVVIFSNNIYKALSVVSSTW